MKAVLSLAVAVFGAVSVAIASPVSPRTPLFRRYDTMQQVARVGKCPTDCWNEAAGRVNCDPNLDDDCLCGKFFDEVTSCTAATCSIGENLATLDFLEEGCN